MWPGNFPAGYLPKEEKNTNLEISMHPYVHGSIAFRSQDMEAAWVSISRSIITHQQKIIEYIFFVTAWAD